MVDLLKKRGKKIQHNTRCITLISLQEQDEIVVVIAFVVDDVYKRKISIHLHLYNSK